MCLAYQTARPCAAAASNDDHQPHPALQTELGVLQGHHWPFILSRVLGQSLRFWAAFDGATSLSQRCPDKPLRPWADKGLKGEELHTVQTLLLLICYFDTQLSTNLL